MLPPVGSSDVFRLTEATSKAGTCALLIHAFANMIANPTLRLTVVLNLSSPLCLHNPLSCTREASRISNPLTILFRIHQDAVDIPKRGCRAVETQAVC